MKFCRVREQENNYRKHVIMILMFNPRSVLSEIVVAFKLIILVFSFNMLIVLIWGIKI